MIEITENYIDIKNILAQKGVKVPAVIVHFLNRLLHVKDINRVLYKNRDCFGLNFVHAFLDDLDIKTITINPENIPTRGYPIIVGNHPLGGPDGLIMLNVVGNYRKDILFPVNDFLMHLPALQSFFVPIDKVHHNATNTKALDAAFAGGNVLLYFPAGICSRRQKGEVRDLEWKPTFIKRALKYKRDVVPVFFDAHNRHRFYTIANLRKWLGFKFNFEMALLPSEMFAQCGNTFRLVVGTPIPYTTFDNRHSPKEWATLLHDFVYQLKDDPTAQFLG